jgi:hypothetical protein
MVLLHSRIDQGASVVRLPKIAMQSAIADNVVAFVAILVAAPDNRGVSARHHRVTTKMIAVGTTVSLVIFERNDHFFLVYSW